MTLIETVFGVPLDRFVAESWPDRVRHASGRADRLAGIGTAWLPRLVDELGIAFAAHACEHATTPAARPGNRELMIVQERGRVEYTIDDATYVLEPGAALFVPRGQMFGTRVIEDSAAHVFAFGVPSWLDMLVNTALTELGKDLAWRGRAAPDDAELRAAIEPILEQLRALRPPRR